MLHGLNLLRGRIERRRRDRRGRGEDSEVESGTMHTVNDSARGVSVMESVKEEG